MSPTRSLASLGHWAFALLPALPLSLDQEAIEEFRRYFRRYDDTPTRVEAVLSLEDCELPEVVDELLIVFKGDDPAVAQAAVEVLGGFRTRPPVERMLALVAGDPSPPIHVGILRALALGAYGDVTQALLPGMEDKNWVVRRWTVTALAAAPDEAAHAALLVACDDAEVGVRCAALEGLARGRSRAVLVPAHRDLAHSSWQVRACAIDVLGRVRDAGSIEPLIERLEVEQGRLRADVAQALTRLTTKDLGLDPQAWRRFWGSFGEGYVLPSEDQIARLEASRSLNRQAYAGAPIRYHGIPTPSRAIVFVLDVSGSMDIEVSQREGLSAEGLESFRRLDVVRAELLRTIDALESDVRFNVVSFATEVERWKKGVVPARDNQKQAARRWVERLRPAGGGVREHYSHQGLAGLPDKNLGRTNTYGALMDALDAAGRGARDRHYEVAVDTIFFLSDGQPSTGEFVYTDDILREVRDANSLRRVVIHTIAIGEFEKAFMQDLAQQNGGRFADLGW